MGELEKCLVCFSFLGNLIWLWFFTLVEPSNSICSALCPHVPFSHSCTPTSTSHIHTCTHTYTHLIHTQTSTHMYTHLHTYSHQHTQTQVHPIYKLPWWIACVSHFSVSATCRLRIVEPFNQPASLLVALGSTSKPLGSNTPPFSFIFPTW